MFPILLSTNNSRSAQKCPKEGFELNLTKTRLDKMTIHRGTYVYTRISGESIVIHELVPGYWDSFITKWAIILR